MADAILGFLRSGDIAGLKRRLAADGPSDLREAWPALEPLERAAALRLLEPGPAVELYRALDDAGRCFFLAALEPGSIAPLLETLRPGARSLFHRLPEEALEAMIRS